MHDDSDEPIYTYNDKYIRYFVRHSIKWGRVCALNHCFKLENCGDILKIISGELKLNEMFMIL